MTGVYTHKLVWEIKQFCKRPPSNHSTLSPGPVRCRCPVSTVDRTGITLTACLKYMARWQKRHISSRVSLFGISQNRTKPQIPLGGVFGFFSRWLRSNIFVSGTWRLLLPIWWARIPLCFKPSYWGTRWGLHRLTGCRLLRFWRLLWDSSCSDTVLGVLWGFFFFFIWVCLGLFNPLTLLLL